MWLCTYMYTYIFTLMGSSVWIHPWLRFAWNMQGFTFFISLLILPLEFDSESSLFSGIWQNLFSPTWEVEYTNMIVAHFVCRILGNQLLPPQDNGYQHVSGSPRTYGTDGLLHDVTEQDITSSNGFNEYVYHSHLCFEPVHLFGYTHKAGPDAGVHPSPVKSDIGISWISNIKSRKLESVGEFGSGA